MLGSSAAESNPRGFASRGMSGSLIEWLCEGYSAHYRRSTCILLLARRLLQRMMLRRRCGLVQRDVHQLGLVPPAANPLDDDDRHDDQDYSEHNPMLDVLDLGAQGIQIAEFLT